MKFSYGWIRELVPELDTAPADLERLITMKTAECEGIEPFGGHFANIVAARVLTVEPIGKGKNKKVRIEAGDGKQATVICGAGNVRADMLAAWAPAGTSLGGKIIREALIEGVESEGMLASGAELGINRDTSGLLELTAGQVGEQPGEGLRRLRPDWIIEIDNKSLTHRPDLWGHYGLAREVAAITGKTLRDPVDASALPHGAPAFDPAFEVVIEDYALCPRYSALLFDEIAVKASPAWLQARLESIGLNCINNIVDTTNYVLAELPQPMHAFDRDKLKGDKIFVRPARQGELLRALNGETYTLAEADLVIADEAGPIALAGVIGGSDSAISETTTRIVLESANFDASSVRLTSARHKLRTDASMRFEKSLDPENTVRGLSRAAALLSEVAKGARAAGGVIDNRGPVRMTQPIALPISFVVRKLGKELSSGTVAGILRALGFGVDDSSPEVLSVKVPTWRATKDISLKDDLVEEVGRMVGYSEIVPRAPLVASVVPPENPMRGYLREVRRVIADQGFSEVYNYSFVTKADVERFEMDAAEHIEVRNPIASELTHLRRSLLPGLFRNIAGNVRHYPAFRLFEIGNEIHPVAAGTLPDEVTHLAAALYGARADAQSFFEMKRALECVLPGARVAAAEKPERYEHPARAGVIHWHEAQVGRLFELHPSLLAREGIQGRAMLFDIDLRHCLALAEQVKVHYTPLRKYPTSGFDLSVLAAVRTPAGELQNLLAKFAGGSLASIEFIRQFEGSPLPEGQKSVSFHMETGALDHTLTSDEASEIFNRIIDGMQAAGYQIRGRDLESPHN